MDAFTGAEQGQTSEIRGYRGGWAAGFKTSTGSTRVRPLSLPTFARSRVWTGYPRITNRVQKADQWLGQSIGPHLPTLWKFP